MDNFFERSITLVELLVAVALLGLLVIAVCGLESFAKYHLLTSDRRAVLQNDISLCIEQIVKDAKRAIGNVGDPAEILCNADDLQLRWDSNGNGIADPYNDGGDTLARFVVEGNDLNYYYDYGRVFTACASNSACDTLTNKVVYQVGDPPIFTCVDGVLRIRIVLRYDTANLESVDNPQLRMLSRVNFRSVSIQ